MPLDLLIGLVTFAAVTCFTPGPNNAMLLASGLNFGVQRTLPHVFGVTLGYAFMVLAVALGIGRLFEVWPAAYVAMRMVAVAYLLWLAWGIATAGGIDGAGGSARPMSFFEACAFQWINPKGWIMAVGASTGYAIAGSPVTSSAIMATVFGVIGLASSATWAGFGAVLHQWLDRPALVRAVNITLALLLVASLYPVFAELRESLNWPLGSR